MSSQQIPNNNGAQDALLNSVKSDTLKCSVKGLNAKELALVENIVNNIFSSYINRDDFERDINSASIDVILGRIASLFDEVKDNFTTSELEEVKKAIITEINLLIINNLNLNPLLIEQIILCINNTVDLLQLLNLERIKLQLDDFLKTTNNIEDSVDIEKSLDFDTLTTTVSDTINTEQQKNIDEQDEKISELINQEKSDNDNNEDEKTLTLVICDLSTQLTKLFLTINNTFLELDVLINSTNEKINVINKKIEQNIKLITNLIPNNKDKKEKKKQKTLQEKINKIIAKMFEQIELLCYYIENFANLVVANLQKILDKIFSTIVKFWYKFLITQIIPILVLVGACLYLLVEPLMTVLLPIMTFIENVFTKILNFLAPVRDFLIDVLQAVFSIIEPALVAFFKGLAPCAEAVAIGLSLFVRSVLKVLTLLMNGIATCAYALGKALVIFATSIVTILCWFMEGIKNFAFAIGQGLGFFVRVVLDVLCWLLEGFGTQAKAIGEAVGKIVLGIVSVVELIVQFLEECVGILVAIVGAIRDFFEGIRSKAKAIGEMIGTIIYNFFKGIDKHAKAVGEAVAELVLVTSKIIVKILKFILNFKRELELNVIAPFKAFKRKLTALKVLAANYEITYPNGIDIQWRKFSFGLKYGSIKPLAFLTGGMTQSEIDRARFDKDKSIIELAAEEMKKTLEAFDAEDKAAELDKMRALLDENKLKMFIDNISIVDELFQLTKTLHEHIFGKDKTDELLKSVLSLLPDMDDVKKINEHNQLLKDDMQNKLELAKSEGIDNAKNNILSEKDFLENLIKYLTENFNKVFEKVNIPDVVPMQLTSTPSAAGMEDK